MTSELVAEWENILAEFRRIADSGLSVQGSFINGTPGNLSLGGVSPVAADRYRVIAGREGNLLATGPITLSDCPRSAKDGFERWILYLAIDRSAGEFARLNADLAHFRVHRLADVTETTVLEIVDECKRQSADPQTGSVRADTPRFLAAMKSTACGTTRLLAQAQWEGVQAGQTIETVNREFRKKQAGKLGKTAAERKKEWSRVAKGSRRIWERYNAGK